ncbi:MAG TPA: CynX/NimT family MFS transporter, partial [Burkholderiaceae bacterium]|nr:CynX/NimT family MFS transporter [Burkholderiaceae bacterium]
MPQQEASANPAQASSRRNRILLIVALFLVGINLRPALSSVAAILEAIRAATGMSSTGAGVLTTLPILCFGIFAPLAPRLTYRWVPERIVLYGLLLLALGIGARIFFGLPGLFVGTVLVGGSISVVMVLLPGIIKRDFPHRLGLMTGVYTMALCLGAALAAGMTVPIQHLAQNDWRPALAFWALPAVLAAWAWWPQLRQPVRRGHHGGQAVRGMYSSKLAWQVTCFMGLQSALAYCVFGWLPTILIDRGMTPLDAGLVLSLSIGAQLVTALAGPWLATRGSDQRAAIVLMLGMTIVGLFGCLYAPLGSIWWWAALLGLGQGGAFSIALTLIVLRAPNPQATAALSGMAQGVGYSLAALGPLAVGLLHDASRGWNSSALLFILIFAGSLAAGLGAGRNLYV